MTASSYILKKSLSEKNTAGSDSTINIFTHVLLFFIEDPFSPKPGNDFHTQGSLNFLKPGTRVH